MFGFDEFAGGMIIVFGVLFIFLPFLINSVLARTRGKSVALILLLTLIFSWVVTLILAFMPKVPAESK